MINKKIYAESEKKIDRLFNPETIAVIGASDTEGGVGNALMRNLISNNYKGTVYPVNSKRDSVSSIKAYKSVFDIPDKIDLAIIATPARAVVSLVEECGRAGVSGIVIISAGFSETGDSGRSASEQILAIAREYDMRIVGPNCLGFIRPSINLNASFANKMALPGKLAFISQSGALCASILDWSVKNNVGFSHFVSIGESLDINFSDLIDYFGNDPNTDSILMYMESLKDARKFMSAARAFSKLKPIIVLKVGRTKEGASAAQSHTGSLAGDDISYDAAFERAGVIRVDTAVGLFHVAKTLAMQKRPAGSRITVVTNAGGPGVIATDYLISRHGKLATLEEKTAKKLKTFLPEAASVKNPVDILGDADHLRYKRAVETCLDDKGTDAVLVILTPQFMTDPVKVAREIVSINNKNNKTLMASWMGGDDVTEGRRILERGNVPTYRSPEDAIRTFSYIDSYSKNLETLKEMPATIPHAFTPKTAKNKRLIEDVIADNRTVLTEEESKKLLENYGIPVLKNIVAKNTTEAVRFSKKIGFPVVMKISSPDIIHKTDVGGVKLDIKSSAEVKTAFQEIIKSVKKHHKKARINGIFIEKMETKRYELLIGCKKDKTFGPVIVFGMGGVAVEIFRDTKAGLPPLNMFLAQKMIEDTKIYRLLKGYRNMPDVDITAIQFLLYKFAYLIADFPEIKELDINPFAIDEHGGAVLDAKVVLDEDIIGRKIAPYSHLVISPYPKEYVTQFTLKNKKKVLVRPIKPEDEAMELEMFKNLSAKTKKQKFFYTIEHISKDMLKRYAQIDYDREIALVAEIEHKQKKQIAGVVRLLSDPYNDTAEFSLLVADSWQGAGLGSKFTAYILDIAKKRNIKRVWANFLSDNQAMFKIFEKQGFKMSGKGKVLKAELDL